jgi:hypothetical protein
VQTSALLAALAAALGFALSTSLQHHAAGDAPDTVRGAAGLLSHLLRRPLWLVGQVLAFASFCLHAFALHLGALALVQPVVVSGIVLAVPIRAALTRQRPPAGELHLLAGRARSAATRAGLYGVVAGVLFGMVAALVKLALQRLSDGGVVSLLTGWPIWLVVVLGLSGVAVNQQAYRVGALSASMPILNVVNVLVALTFGVLVFHEIPAHTPLALAIEVAALACIAGGLAGLSRHAEPPVPAATA